MAYEARTEEGSKAAFGASEMCCYFYPEDTALDKGRRAAFMDGAAWAADEIERLRIRNAALVEALKGHNCPADYRVTVAECKNCGCTDGLLIQPLKD